MQTRLLAAGAILALAPTSIASAALRPQMHSAPVPIQIGTIARISDPAPAEWGIAGMPILTLRSTIGSFTPVMRTEALDARLVEILSRTQNPPLSPEDISVTTEGNGVFITVRGYRLMEVHPQDARADGTTRVALAREWARSLRAVLPHITPLPNRRGA